LEFRRVLFRSRGRGSQSVDAGRRRVEWELRRQEKSKVEPRPVSLSTVTVPPRPSTRVFKIARPGPPLPGRPYPWANLFSHCPYQSAIARSDIVASSWSFSDLLGATNATTA